MHIAPVFQPSRSKYLVFTSHYLLPFLLCLGVITLVYFVLYSPFFKISSVTCTLDFQDCQDPSLLVELAKLNGKNIFTLKEASVSQKLTSGDFTIRQANLKKILPRQVIVELASVYPVVAIQVESNNTWVVLDQKYRVIASLGKNPNVPTVIVTGPLTLIVGKPPSDNVIIQALSLALRLSQELLSLTSLTLVDGNTIELALAGGKTAIFTPQKDELTQIRSLQAVLSDATITKGIHTIDVRFASPVLR